MTAADAPESFAAGVVALAEEIRRQRPDVVLVAGDRVEAFAAACAAMFCGVHLAHIHGGDRAAGKADEQIRHAISKMAHLHLVASGSASERLVRMGENPQHVVVVGPPASESACDIPSADDVTWDRFGRPEIVFLMHPPADARLVGATLERCRHASDRVIAIEPNHDDGAEDIKSALSAADIPAFDQLPRRLFVGLLRRGAILVGNSSAAFIECAALGIPAVNVGDRQHGRASTPNLCASIEEALRSDRSVPEGGVIGSPSRRIADTIATWHDAGCPLAKVNAY